MAKINVIIKRPGEKPIHTNISNTLENLQKTVEGRIETVTISNDCVIICNGDSRLLGMPYNAVICGYPFVGPIIIAGVKGEEFSDIPFSWEEAKALFPTLWRGVL